MEILKNRKTSFALVVVIAALFGCGQSSDTQVARVPVHADAAPSDLSIKEVAAGVWIHTSYYTFESGTRVPSNGVIIREGDHLLLLDSAWGAEATTELLELIRRDIGLPVTRAIATHFHDDRISGVDVLAQAGVEVLAHPMTLKLSTEKGGPVPEFALPGIEQAGSATAVGSVEVLYPGAAHAHDNIMVWIPAQQILYGGCAIRELAATTQGNTEDADVASWPVAVKRAAIRYPDVKIVVPGHGEPGGPELLIHTVALFETGN